MSDPIDPRDFGRLEAEVSALKDMLSTHGESMRAMSEQLHAMNATLSEARGGWRTLLWIGGASASLGGAVSWALNHLALK
jgi:hypothetical protein